MIEIEGNISINKIKSVPKQKSKQLNNSLIRK